ncbi:3'-5' exonuclease [Planctobacterium marinum]|uniref:3'-5' exonuclease n=1 Tax=Planctobacterium marinum TaxID=1631968 RepID=UPI001E64B570|nr:3'-5' exonuclease [Planctobacterium marinum]MCC2604807.1 3'-5' exonuclease [Planctobacterium marinum]
MDFWHAVLNRLGLRIADGELLRQRMSEVALLAVDLELTGLDPQQDDIVSVGWIKGAGFSLDLSSSHHALVQTDSSLKQSPVIHGITDVELQSAVSLQQQLVQLAALADDHVWVMHCHRLDWGVLQKSYRQCQLTCPSPVIIDTLLLEQYLLGKSGYQNSPVSLTESRRRYGLATAPAHNALEDAAATLELLFAQLGRLGVKPDGQFKQLSHTGALISG